MNIRIVNTFILGLPPPAAEVRPTPLPPLPPPGLPPGHPGATPATPPPDFTDFDCCRAVPDCCRAVPDCCRAFPDCCRASTAHAGYAPVASRTPRCSARVAAPRAGVGGSGTSEDKVPNAHQAPMHPSGP